jgi:fluoride exporter
LKLLLIGIGGFIGSISRYLLEGIVSRHTTISFPYGTLVVNVLGCFLIGLFFGVAEGKLLFNINVRSFIVIGLFGGFTTFSTFSYETFSLFKEGEIFFAISNIAISIIIGILALWGGHMLGKLT